ncbi:hypothetical protein [Hydrogenophaga laconesensis]|uniref:Uncharacterized protein n=1 Tax=Hydrogenophaga laconesensis TaxID=1805971 RepID=A0ABU1V9T2_9BURK|nr:hypothetical protein [Hydrogenophaga laconesensis]MDR7094218.1 hypothetical protein [Hydrogenophaga laconesensis]
MIKIFIAFAIFAAVAIFALMKGGDIDMGGEKHGMDHVEHPAPAAPAPAATPAAPAPAEQPK